VLAITFLSGEGRFASGQAKALVVPPAPQSPTLTGNASLGAKVGESVELILAGTNLNDPVAVLLSCPGKVSIPTDNKNGTDAAKLRVKVELPANCPIGLHTLRIATKSGVSNFRPFIVDEIAAVAEVDTNRSKDTPQVVSIPTVISARTDAEVSDFYKVKITPGQTLTFEVIARRIGSPLDPIIVLHDAKTKRELVELYADDTPGLQSDCRLTHTFKDGGEFLVEVRDTTYRGGADYNYRLRIGEFPGATTAFPVAAQRGQTASIAFAGPGTSDIPPVSLKAPADPSLEVVYVSPKKSGVAGWPVPVRLSDWPEAAEQEPNDEPAKANKLPVPGGVTGRFEKGGDVDHFAIVCKKGVKYAATATTFEINSPCEVLTRVLDDKGKEIARSNPAQSTVRVEFTPAADGNFTIACEQLNFVSGPNEIYHLTVQPVTADFSIVLASDRGEAPVGGGTAIAATVNRLNGYAGPVELSIVGDAALSGKVTLPAGQTVAFVPLMVKDGTQPGAYAFRVKGSATVNDQTIVRVGTMVDTVKATLGGMPNPPAELLSDCALAVVEKAPFTLQLTADPASIEKGKDTKVMVEAVRGTGADAEIAIAPLFLPTNVTAAAPPKPIAKGATKTDLTLKVAPTAVAGSSPTVFRATTKIGGKDFAIIPPPLMIDITEPKKKDEPKKDEPKKDKK